MSSQCVTLGTVCEFINGGAWRQTEYSELGVPVLQVSNIEGNAFDIRQFKRLNESSAEKYEKNRISLGDVIVATVGSHAGSASAAGRAVTATPDVVGFLLNQNAVVIRSNSTSLSQKYLGYLCRADDFQRFAQDAGKGAANQMRIGIGALKSYEFELPSLAEQRRTAEILSAYDDLIENNRRRIALLEEAARLLYREWFVHFRFPGHEHVKITDGLPEGWERRTLVDLAEVVMGQSPKSQFYNEGGEGLPFHQGVTDYGFRFVSHRIYSTMVTKIANAGDILVSVRAPVGRINITRDKIVLGRGLAAVRSRTGHQSFLFYALKNHFYAEDIIGSGAIYAATNKKELEGQLLLVPPSLVLSEFEAQAATIDEQIANLTSQNEKLAQARDQLLPRLMNGEIAV